jgi:predicted Ser/Thr protein kinase
MPCATVAPTHAGTEGQEQNFKAEMVGERILDRFVIERRIGSGGFGTVYRAWDERLQRPVAVKVIDGDERAPRIAREAQAVARLAHRNIATLYELASQDGRSFLVSELIEGEPLRAIGKRGELSDRMVAMIGADAAAALSHAHRNGVIHRDVKPENVLVSTAYEAKLVDFGIARVAGERTLTRTGGVIGTLAYMAPEQADGLRPGPSADVYSLALTLYECFCGEHPLLRDGPAATARAIGEPIAPLGEVRPDLPEQLTETIDACLDPDPESRPLVSELEAVLTGHERELGGEPLPAISDLDPDGDEPEHRWSRPALAPQRLAPALAVAAMALAALIATGGAPVPVLLVAPLAGLLALARPRPALLMATIATVTWVWAGADEPGAAVLIAAVVFPLLLPMVNPRAAPLPALAPLLGLAGLGAAYPAFVGLTRGPVSRAVLGGAGYLWLVSLETISNRNLLLGAPSVAPPAWSDSAGVAISDVLIPLVTLSVIAAAAIWAVAAVILPLLVRGRAPVLDLLGALVWAAGLASGLRLVAGPGGEPPGLLVATALAAIAAAVVAPRLSAPSGARARGPTLSAPGEVPTS